MNGENGYDSEEFGYWPSIVQYLELWKERRRRSFHVFMPMFAHIDASSQQSRAHIINTTRQYHFDLHILKSSCIV